MNQKHREAFRELRQWCEKWDGYLLIQEAFLNSDEDAIYFPTRHRAENVIDTFCAKTQEIIRNDVMFNFMEQEDGNTEK